LVILRRIKKQEREREGQGKKESQNQSESERIKSLNKISTRGKWEGKTTCENPSI
jgi:hypothetical protein